jgi:hypothetical protein
MILKHKIYLKVADIIRTGNIHKFYRIKDDKRPIAEFKLIFFCGASGMSYLNASLVSVHKYWNKLPEICILSDGTPEDDIKKKLIKWPLKVTIYTWQECAQHFLDKGNKDLHTYASNEIIGKKLIGIMYCAEKFPVLYSDSDILWFNSPTEMKLDFNLKPQIKMSTDIDYFYTKPLLKEIDEENCLSTIPFNSGVVFLNGSLSGFPKWAALCKFLGANKNMGWFSEQTSFAVFNNYLNPNNYFSSDEILIKIDDGYDLRSTFTDHKKILARHYVHVKATTFWRDFVFMLFKKRSLPL